MFGTRDDTIALTFRYLLTTNAPSSPRIAVEARLLLPYIKKKRIMANQWFRGFLVTPQTALTGGCNVCI